MLLFYYGASAKNMLAVGEPAKMAFVANFNFKLRIALNANFINNYKLAYALDALFCYGASVHFTLRDLQEDCVWDTDSLITNACFQEGTGTNLALLPNRPYGHYKTQMQLDDATLKIYKRINLHLICTATSVVPAYVAINSLANMRSPGGYTYTSLQLFILIN